jgi:hypothetical protein
MAATTFTVTETPAGRMWQSQTVFSEAERAEIERRDREGRERNRAAVSVALAAVEKSAGRTAAIVTKIRARAYLERPAKLNALRLNLSQASPQLGLRIVERLYADEPKVAHFPVSTTLTDLAAARVAFRWARRFEQRRNELQQAAE